MNKGLKISAITLGVIIILMLLLPFAFQGKIAGIVKTEGNKMLNAQFDFKKLNISLFRDFPKASISLEDFYLKGTGAFANDTLFQAGEVTASINLFSLFGNSGYDISKIVIEDTRLHAIVLPSGQVNWDIMKPDTTEANLTPETETATFKIKLQSFIVKNMSLIYDDQQGKMYAAINEFNAQCSGDLSSDRTTLKLEGKTTSLTYKMDGIPFLSNANVSALMNIDADLANNTYTLKDNSISINAIQASIDGWLKLRDTATDMDLKLNTNDVGFKEILSLIPSIYATEFSTLKTDGTATLAASAKGTLQGDTVPSFNIAIAVKNGMFRYPALPAGVDQININANIQNPGGDIDLTTIHINPFSFSIAGNPFSMKGDFKTLISDPDFNIEAKGVLDLGMIKKVYPLADLELNGTINANMQASGRLSYIEKEKYDEMKASGTIGLSNMRLKMKDMPDVDIKKSLFTFTPQYLQLSETTVNIGENDITADSRFEDYIGYVLKGNTLKGTLNIQSNYLNLNDFIALSTDTVGSKSAVSDSTAMAGTIEIPHNIDFQMNATLKKVLFDKMTFNDMKGKLTVKDGKVDMSNLSMNTMGGNVVMNGYYSTAEPKQPKIKAGFKLSEINFSQAYKELDMVQQLAPIFESLKGNFSGQINVLSDLDKTMSPVLETMQGDGKLSTHNLNLSGVKAIDQIADATKQANLKNINVKDMTLDFTIKDGKVATKPFDIKMGDYNLNLSGTTGLDQTIDYSGKVKLPPSTGLSKAMTLDLKIGGSFNSPKVSIDTKSMANQAVESVANEAINKLGKKLGVDSVNTANKDSLKQKVTEKALDFLKKRLK